MDKNRAFPIAAFAVSVMATAAWSADNGATGRTFAESIFGGGLVTPASTFSPLLFEGDWVSHGSVGGFDPDADGWRTFVMRTANRPPEAPRIKGRVRFTPAADGTVRGEWLVVPTADAPLLELCVGGRIPLSRIGGGTALLDDKPLEIPAEIGSKPHLFRGPVSTLAFRDREGQVLLNIAFDTPTRLLLQDNRHWNVSDITIRLFFAEGPVTGGREYAVRATFSTPSDGPLDLREGEPVHIKAGPDWIPLANEPLIESGSALDFSTVIPHHAPAGKFGRVVAVGGHFEFEQLPGVPQRFYGVNICGDANTPSPESVDRFATNLARMGYNALRIHHHERNLISKDAQWHEGLDDTVPDPERLARFDALVAACIRHGIYLTTDLFVSRSHLTTWRSLGIDRDGCISNTQNFKTLCAFYEPAYSNLCAWTRNFLGHVNPHTGRSLAEEPALAVLALINEGNLGNSGAAPFHDLPGVAAAWQAWLAAKRSEELRVTSDERMVTKNSSLVTRHSSLIWDEIPDSIPDNLYAADGATPANLHAAAFALFLADAETRLAERLRVFLRDELHCQTPLSSLSCWYNPVQYQLPRTTFDYVDDHFYVDHPSFLDEAWRLPSRCPNVNPMTGPGAGARSVVFRRLMDKPFCITEFNYSGPGRFRGVGGIATGALGALQDWSGIWRFAWTHGRAGVEKPETKTLGYFDLSGDPLSLAAERAALCLFLRGDLSVLPAAYPVALSEAALRDPRNGAPKCEAPVWLWAGWHARLGTKVMPMQKNGELKMENGELRIENGKTAAFTNPVEQVRKDLAELGAAVCGNGAVSIDSVTGTFLLDTPRTAGGFAESGTNTAGVLRFVIAGGDGPAPKKDSGSQNSSLVTRHSSLRGGDPVAATVWASSLDGEPLATSSHILVTHLTDVQNTGIEYADATLTTLLKWGALPHLMRRGAAEISLAIGDGEWTVYRLSPSGRRLGEVAATREADTGRLAFTARTDLDPASATFLYELVKRP